MALAGRSPFRPGVISDHTSEQTQSAHPFSARPRLRTSLISYVPCGVCRFFLSVFDLAEVAYSVRRLNHKFPFRGELDVPWAIRKCCTLSYDDFRFTAKALVHSKRGVNCAVLSHALLLSRICLPGQLVSGDKHSLVWYIFCVTRCMQSIDG